MTGENEGLAARYLVWEAWMRPFENRRASELQRMIRRLQYRTTGKRLCPRQSPWNREGQLSIGCKFYLKSSNKTVFRAPWPSIVEQQRLLACNDKVTAS